MAPNLAIEALLDAGHVLDVIDVAVCEKEQFQIDTARIDPIAGALRRIEEDPAFRGRDEVAICLENPAAERLINHFV